MDNDEKQVTAWSTDELLSAIEVVLKKMAEKRPITSASLVGALTVILHRALNTIKGWKAE